MIMVLMLMLPYLIGCGITFVAIGERTTPHDYWESPIPFFSSLLWPAVVPALIGGAVAKSLIGKESKTERKREKELAEANHRLKLAEAEAKITRALERSLTHEEDI